MSDEQQDEQQDERGAVMVAALPPDLLTELVEYMGDRPHRDERAGRLLAMLRRVRVVEARMP